MDKKRAARLSKFWREWVKPILAVVIVLSTFRSAVADWHDVPTGSMKPTIVEGDRILVNKLAYDLRIPFTSYRLAEWSQPERGDIVVLFSPETGDRLVKRVVAIPGDAIAMRDNRLFINDQPITYEPLDDTTIDQIAPAEKPNYQFTDEHLDAGTHPIMTVPLDRMPLGQRAPSRRYRYFDAVQLGPDDFFVMGDNRDRSKDSRFFGTADRSLIVGRVRTVVLSVDRDNYYLPRVERFFRHIP